MGLGLSTYAWGIGTFAVCTVPLALAVANAHAPRGERAPAGAPAGPPGGPPSGLRIGVPWAAGVMTVTAGLLVVNEAPAVVSALRGVSKLGAGSHRNLAISAGLTAAVTYLNRLSRPERLAEMRVLEY